MPEIKVKSRCLSKHHAVKAYRSGGIAPHILNLGVGWRRVVSFTPRPLIFQNLYLDSIYVDQPPQCEQHPFFSATNTETAQSFGRMGKVWTDPQINDLSKCWDSLEAFLSGNASIIYSACH